MPIATRRPYDDPGAARVYYRLQPEREALLAKTHMPYELSAARKEKFRSWFLASAYKVNALPSYDVDTASNPFAAFRDLPVEGHYRFLLDEAEYFVMNFIKGPVCRGDLAVDVIEDRFWVFFVEPEAGTDIALRELLAREQSDLRLPAEWGSNSLLVVPWLADLLPARRRVRRLRHHFNAGTGAGGEHADSRAGLHRRVSERDFSCDSGRGSRTRGGDRINVVRS